MAAWALPCLLWNLQVDLKITPDRMGLWHMKFTFSEFGRHFSIASFPKFKHFHLTLSLAQLKTLHRSWLYSLNIISCIRELQLLQWSPQHKINEHPCFGKLFFLVSNPENKKMQHLARQDCEGWRTVVPPEPWHCKSSLLESKGWVGTESRWLGQVIGYQGKVLDFGFDWASVFAENSENNSITSSAAS